MSYTLCNWGKEFPVDASIFLTSLVSRDVRVKQMLRTLTSIFFLYEDNSILIIPVEILQSKKECESILKYLNGKNDKLSPKVFYKLFATKVIIVFSCNFDQTYITINVDYTYDKISVTPNGIEHILSNEPLSSNDINGRLISASFQYPYLILTTERSKKYTVYSSLFFNLDGSIIPQPNFGNQCQISPNSLPIICPSKNLLAILTDTGISGCAFDSTGQRIFPRSLQEIIKKSGFIPIEPLNRGYILDVESGNIHLLSNCDPTNSLSPLPIFKHIDLQIGESNSILKAFLIHGSIFLLTKVSIQVYELMNCSLIHSWDTPPTDQWMLSLDSTYGAVMLGKAFYTIAKIEVPPALDLYAEPNELREQMNSIEAKTGSVAGAITVLAERSLYYGAAFNVDAIGEEINTIPPKMSLKNEVRPTLIELYDLLLHQPNIDVQNDK